jgi:hypothetical protein
MRPRFLIPAESLKRSRRSNQYSNWLAIGSRQPTFLAALALDMDAVADTAPAVREVMKSLPGFKDIGKRILTAWGEGVSVLRDSRMYGLGPWKSAAAFEGISDPPKLKNPRTVIGRSELLAHRTKSKSK